MAAPNQLTAWLLANADDLGLRATEFTWPKSWGMDNLVDLEVSIELDGRKFIGRGTARDEDLAFLKAGAEALERAICANLGLRTMGIALHTDDALALMASKAELLERDAFFCHFFTKTPFRPAGDHLLDSLKTRNKNIFDVIEQRGICIKLYHDFRYNQPLVICLARGEAAQRPFGCIIGLSLKNDVIAAAEAAFLECARNIAALCFSENIESDISLEDFCQIPKPSSVDRQRLARNIKYWRSMAGLFPASAEIILVHTEPEVISERLPINLEKIKSAPIVAYRSLLNPNKYGQLLFGKTSGEPVTLFRLSEFLGKLPEDIEQRPHFLG